MKYVFLIFFIISFSSCWKYNSRPEPEPEPPQPLIKVWGSKPIYAAEKVAKNIYYMGQKQPIITPGNICALGTYVFQVDVGRGIHVIDNSIPAQADRVGFIVLKGCAQISIRGKYLYTNSYNDLVTVDIADPNTLREVSRIKNVFPEYQSNYFLVTPIESGYYVCPKRDSIVVGWVKDSIYTYCYKN